VLPIGGSFPSYAKSFGGRGASRVLHTRSAQNGCGLGGAGTSATLLSGKPLLLVNTIFGCRHYLHFMNIIAWVYILTNKHNTTLYVGSSDNLWTRLWEHRTKRIPKSFTARYNIYKLIYYEGFEFIEEAGAREEYIKGKSRKWKEQLINKMNPEWNDLTEQINPKKKIKR
jgi:putative endonuclease